MPSSIAPDPPAPMSEFERLCSNNLGPCKSMATMYCHVCKLVGYCSVDCAQSHYNHHFPDCNNKLGQDWWEPNYRKEHRCPNMPGTAEYRSTPGLGGKTFLWGNTPAFDLLSLAKNEGEGYQGNLNLYFAASGDLRNVVTTLASIPQDYQGRINCVINDFDREIASKNLFLLKALMLQDDEVKAAETVLNLWYSAKIPLSELDEYRKISTQFNAQLTSSPRFSSKFEECGMSKEVITHGDYKLQLISTWKENDQPKFPCNLRKEQYGKVEASRKVAITGFTERNVDPTMAPNEYTDALQLYYEFRLTPKQRVADMHFRRSGVLMPFAARPEDRYVPNPTLYNKDYEWMPNAWKSPMTGWLLKDVLASGTRHQVPVNDIYGAMYFHVRDLLVQFHRSIRNRPTRFFLTNSDAAQRPSRFSTTVGQSDSRPLMEFDRIDTSNIADECWLGIDGCLAMGKWLKPKEENPFATLMTSFMQAVRDFVTELHDAPTDALKKRPELRRTLLPRCIMIAEDYNEDFLDRQVRYMFRDLDNIFRCHTKKYEFVGKAKKHGMAQKFANTIIEKFPYRTFATDSARDIELKRFQDSPGGSECYIEWEIREGEISDEEECEKEVEKEISEEKDRKRACGKERAVEEENNPDGRWYDLVRSPWNHLRNTRR